MKKIKHLLISLLLIFGLVLAVTSCDEEEDTTVNISVKNIYKESIDVTITKEDNTSYQNHINIHINNIHTGETARYEGDRGNYMITVTSGDLKYYIPRSGESFFPMKGAWDFIFCGNEINLGGLFITNKTKEDISIEIIVNRLTLSGERVPERDFYMPVVKPDELVRYGGSYSLRISITDSSGSIYHYPIGGFSFESFSREEYFEFDGFQITRLGD